MSGMQVGELYAILGLKDTSFVSGLATNKARAVGFSGILRKSLLAGVAGFAVLGAAAIKFGDDMQDATNTIRVGTGATGKKLASLKQDFNDVVSDVPADFASASTAIADLNTRLGITGPRLRTLAEQELSLAKITKTDVGENIRLSTRMFGDWSISTSKQAEAMDEVFRAYQQTGIGIQDLMGTVVQFGAPLRNLGFDFESSIAMLSKWEKEGVNVQTVLAGMRFALKTFAREGVDPMTGMKKAIEDISKASSKAKAMKIGGEIFGLRGASDVVAAIREGRFQYDELVKSISKGSDTIQQAEEDTRTWHDNLTLLKNNALVALDPVLKRTTSMLSDLTSEVAKLPPELQTVVVASTAAASGIGAFTLLTGKTGVAMRLAGSGISMLGARIATTGFAVKAFLGGAATLPEALGLAMGPIGIAVAGIGALAGALYLLKRASDAAQKAETVKILQPEIQTKLFDTALVKQLEKMGYHKRVVDGVVYFDYTVKPRPKDKGRGGSDLGWIEDEASRLTVRAENTMRRQARRLSRTADNLAAEVQAEALARGGPNSIMALLGLDGKYKDSSVKVTITELRTQLDKLIEERDRILRGTGKRQSPHLISVDQLNTDITRTKERLDAAIQVWADAQAKMKAIKALEPQWDFSGGVEKIREQARDYRKAIKDFLNPPKPKKFDVSPVVSSLKKGNVTLANLATAGGKRTASNLAGGLRSGQGGVKSAARDLSNASKPPRVDTTSLGASIGSGLAAGMRAQIPAVQQAASELAKTAKNAMHAGIKNPPYPSGEGILVGESIAVGMIRGMTSRIGDVATAGLRLSQSAVSSASGRGFDVSSASGYGMSITIENINVGDFDDPYEAGGAIGEGMQDAFSGRFRQRGYGRV